MSYPEEPPPPYPGAGMGGTAPPPPFAPGSKEQSPYPQGYPPAQGQPIPPPTQYPPSQPPPGQYPPAGGPPPPVQQPPTQGSAAYYPQQNPYGPGSAPVIINQPTVVTTVVQQFRDAPTHTTCPTCHAQVVTEIRYENGTMAWVLCVVLCLVGCDLGCCLIPFCVDQCKDVLHYCPNCHNLVSRWNRM